MRAALLKMIWHRLMPGPEYRYRANRVLDMLERKKITTALAPPRLVYLELASLCNLKCPFCPTGVGKVGRPPGFMTWEVFKTVVDDVGPMYPETFVHMWGESLLHPEFNHFVRYAKENGFIHVAVNTNGNIRKDETWVREMVKSGIDLVQVNIDGIDQETYAKYREGGDIQLIFTFLERIQRIKAELGSRTPEVFPLIVVNQYNRDQISMIRERMEKIGLKEIKLRNIKRFTDKKKQTDYSDFDCLKDGFGGMVRLKEDGQVIKKTRCQSNDVLACPSLWAYLHVSSQGAYLPCCQSFGEEDVLDRVEKTKPLDFWFSKRMRLLRRLNLVSPEKIPICKDCGFIRRRSTGLLSHLDQPQT